MKIFCSSYELRSIASKRDGVLLKVDFGEGKVGYADCHVWPELGDLPLQKQLNLLSNEELTPITQYALEWARCDAEARDKNVPLVRKSCQSHYLITDLFSMNGEKLQTIAQQDFTHLKIKVGKDLANEVRLLKALFRDPPFKLRLDFNECLTATSFRRFLEDIKELKQQMDFIEDPFPFHLEEWKAIQKEGWKLACDRQTSRAVGYPESAAVLVIKPAVQSWERSPDQECVVTSYLGHPLGQMVAAYTASLVDPLGKSRHGLLSHIVYEPTPFSKQLSWDHSSFKIPLGTGFCFDKELAQLTWSPL